MTNRTNQPPLFFSSLHVFHQSPRNDLDTERTNHRRHATSRPDVSRPAEIEQLKKKPEGRKMKRKEKEKESRVMIISMITTYDIPCFFFAPTTYHAVKGKKEKEIPPMDVERKRDIYRTENTHHSFIHHNRDSSSSSSCHLESSGGKKAFACMLARTALHCTVPQSPRRRGKIPFCDVRHHRCFVGLVWFGGLP